MEFIPSQKGKLMLSFEGPKKIRPEKRGPTKNVPPRTGGYCCDSAQLKGMSRN